MQHFPKGRFLYTRRRIWSELLMLSIGIDSGTQSTKVVVLDLESGQVIATARRPVPMISGLPPGFMEQHPADWVTAAEEALLECLAALGERKGEVVAIGVSGQQHGLVVLNERDEVIRPAKLWCDTSTASQCAAFHAEFGGPKGMIELTGNPMLPGYTAPKLLWLKENEPAHFRKIRTVLLPHDYLNFWLTGEKKMEYGDASGTGWMNVRMREWVPEILEFIDPAVVAAIPKVGSSRRPNGLLRSELLAAWGLKGPVVVSAGGGDNMMGAIGTGNLMPGCVTASLGTSGTLYSYASTPVVDPEGEVAAFCDSTDAWLPLVCTMNVTVAIEQVRNLFGWTYEQLDAEVARVPAGAEGLLFLPYLQGERTPNLPSGCGVFHGLNTRNMTPGCMARAVLEGVTMGLAYGLERLRSLGVKPREVRLTGGGSASPVWRQLCADLFGVSTVCLTSPEGAALGAAIQAAATEGEVSGRLGTLRDLAARVVTLDEATRCHPNPKTVETYKPLLAKMEGTTKKLHKTGLL